MVEHITPSWLIFWPVLAAVVVLILRETGKLAYMTSLFFAGVHVILAVALFTKVSTDGIQVESLGGWQAPFGIVLVADTLSASMVIIASVIISFGIIYGLSSKNKRWEFLLFHPLLHVQLCGLSGAFLTGDLFNLFVWFEVILLCSFVLMAKSTDEGNLSGSFKYVMLNLIASVAFLASLGLIYASTGTLNMAHLSLMLEETASRKGLLSSANLLLFAFMVKAAIFPLCFWLPASYHTTSPAVSAVFAGLLTKLGLYAILRVATLILPAHMAEFQTVFVTIACLTMIFGVLGAAGAKNGRRILSFHIISQVGYLFLGIVLATGTALAATMYYFVHHIVAKSNLFFIAGVAERATGERSVFRQGGMLARSPLLTIAFVISAGALAGLPPSSGFFAKFALMLSVAEAEFYIPLFICAVVGLVTLYSMAKVWNETYLKAAPDAAPTNPVYPTGVSQYATVLGLSVVSLSLVVFGGYVFGVCEQIAAELQQSELYIHAVLPNFVVPSTIEVGG